MLHPVTPPYLTFLSVACHHYKRDNEESKMKRMKEEEMEKKRGVGGEGGNRWRNKEGKLFRDGSHDCHHYIPD